MAKPTKKPAPATKKPRSKTTVSPIATGGTIAGATSPPAVATGSAAAYAQYLPIAAAAFPQGQVPRFAGDPALALSNASMGLAALAPYASELAKLPAPFDLAAMQSVPEVAQAAIYAAAQVDTRSAGTIAALRSQVSAVRDVLLSNAVALMKSGVLPAPAVQRIVRGRGVADSAQDCVDLAALFTANAAAVRGKTAITAAQISQAAQVGDQLLSLLKPKNAKQGTLASRNAAALARDQLGALLAQRYVELRRAGMWVWVDAVDDHVPSMRAHLVHKKRAKTPAAPAAKTPAPAATS
jgi:hypothetical protein